MFQHYHVSDASFYPAQDFFLSAPSFVESQKSSFILLSGTLLSFFYVVSNDKILLFLPLEESKKQIRTSVSVFSPKN